MLTAGGADQQVADAGPHGHSVFTWVLLQALAQARVRRQQRLGRRPSSPPAALRVRAAWTTPP